MAPSSSRRNPKPKTPSPYFSSTLDFVITILILFSGAFLIFSCFNSVSKSLSLVLPSYYISHFYSTLEYLTSNRQSVIIFSTLFAISFTWFLEQRSRRCERKECKGLKNALEFDLKLQGEDLLREGDENKAVRDVNELPWKGESASDPFYECLRVELKKMAPPNGRAVLLFRKGCGCPVSKIEGRWTSRRGRRHNRNQATSIGGER